MIIGILGSGSADSLTRSALMTVGAAIRVTGLGFSLLDLSREFRDLHDVAAYAEPEPGSQTARVRARLAPATGVVLATPVYHGTFSGLIKNALDHLTGDAFQGLPVGLVAAGGGSGSASVACDHLRSVVRALGGWSTPTHIGLCHGDMTEDGLQEGLRERIAEMASELHHFIGATDAARAAALVD
jgi:NAD(P)H-dependent FMN reductase